MDDIIVTRRRARAIGGIVAASVLLSLSLPARADEGGLAGIEREVTAIVKRVKPSVVSLRVGPAKRQGRAGSSKKTTERNSLKRKAELLPLVVPGGDSIVLTANEGEAPNVEGGELKDADYRTRVTMSFKGLDDGRTLVEIAEEGWRENQGALGASYGNCQGWSQMLCALKVWIEHGINLREGMYK